MRTLLAIGIGVGDPAHVTMQAAEAMGKVDVFFVLDKGGPATDLTAMRREICARYAGDRPYRTVTIPDPRRDRTGPDYVTAVDDWRTERARVLEATLESELPDDGCGAILVWGDPSLYDGTLAVLEAIVERGELALTYEVIPGVSTPHALAARHRITLNRVAGAVHVTTGRRLAGGLPADADDIVVMLDADLTCRQFRDQEIDIYWGAYLGTPREVLIAGKLDRVVDAIAEQRQSLRAQHGWIMDAYLLRRTGRG